MCWFYVRNDYSTAIYSNGGYKNVLVVGSDKLSKIVDWNDRNTAVFWRRSRCYRNGSCFRRKRRSIFRIRADGSGGKHLYQDEYVMMNGREVFKFAVRQLGDSCLRVLDKAGLTKGCGFLSTASSEYSYYGICKRD